MLALGSVAVGRNSCLLEALHSVGVLMITKMSNMNMLLGQKVMVLGVPLHPPGTHVCFKYSGREVQVA